MKKIKLTGGRYSSEYNEKKANEIAVKILGYTGRMISGSKSGYHNRYPKHFVMFNANIFTVSQGKIWYGDIDVDIDKKNLKKLAKKLGEPIYLVQEMMGRFENENIDSETMQKKAYWNTDTGFREDIWKYHKIWCRRCDSKRIKKRFKRICDYCGKVSYRTGDLIVDLTEEEGNVEIANPFCECGKGFFYPPDKIENATKLRKERFKK